MHLQVIQLLDHGHHVLAAVVRHHDDRGVRVGRGGGHQQLVEVLVVRREDQPVSEHLLPARADDLAVREVFTLPEVRDVRLRGRGEKFCPGHAPGSVAVGGEGAAQAGAILRLHGLAGVLVGLSVVPVLRHPVAGEALLSEGHGVDILLGRHALQAGGQGVAQGTEYHVLKW